MSGGRPGRRPDPDQSRSSPIVLPRKRSGDLRVGCLSWSQDFTDGVRWLSAGELVRSLNLVRQERQFKADLVLCSGAAIWDDGTESDQIAKAAGGSAVLSEWRDHETDPAEWWVASDQGWEQVRRDQYFAEASEVRKFGPLTLREITNGWGAIRFSGCPTTLVLLICNEVRILGREPSVSVLAPTLQASSVPPIFTSAWALLHPSHRPYARRNVHSGWGVVGRTRRKAKTTPALFCDVTKSGTIKKGQPNGPSAVFHAGPWQRGTDWQEQTAGCVFRVGKRWRKKSPVLLDGLIDIRYAEFNLSPPSNP